MRTTALSRPLNQNNDDPVSDFLYTTNFALWDFSKAAATQNSMSMSMPRSTFGSVVQPFFKIHENDGILFVL